MPTAEGDQPDPLARAYEQRTEQLYETRGALAEVVSALRVELEQRRGEAVKATTEADALRADNRALRDNAELLTDENHGLRARVEELEVELSSTQERLGQVRGMKVVRWTAWPRRMVYRVRDRRG